MADARYVVGIDLGTTNCVLAYVDTRQPAPGAEPPSPPALPPALPNVLAVPQVIKPGVVEARAQLPSFAYLPAANVPTTWSGWPQGNATLSGLSSLAPGR